MRDQARRLLLGIVCVVCVAWVVAPGATQTGTIDQRVNDLTAEQQYLKQAMKDNVEGSRFLITAFAVLLTSIVILQAISQLNMQRIQRAREDELDSRQKTREDEITARRLQHERELRDSWLEREKESARSHRIREDELDSRQKTREDEITARRLQHEKELRDWWLEREQESARSHRIREDELDSRQKARDDELASRRLQNEKELRDSRLERERERDEYRRLRDERLDRGSDQGAKAISNILNVLHKTLEARRQAEAQARRAEAGYEATISGLKKTIQDLTNEVGGLRGVAAGVAADVKLTRDNEHQAVKSAATILARVPRHQLRHRLKQFETFLRQYESFLSRYRSADPRAVLDFGPVVSYVRGISAHYENDPSTVLEHLGRVLNDPGDPDDTGRNPRLKVACYFLGVTESNFESYERADEYFRKALDLEVKPPENERLMNFPPDLLTRVVAAEASAMASNNVRATKYLDDIDSLIASMEQECKAADVQLPSSLRRLAHRAILVRVNMKVYTGASGYPAGVEALEKISAHLDPTEYYAKLTLAQLRRCVDPADAGATQLFKDIYASIHALGHLAQDATTETRSRILLLMSAGMAAQFGNNDQAMAAEHLDEAFALLSTLPKRGEQYCSVFSALSKRNESKQTVEIQIKSIRQGEAL